MADCGKSTRSYEQPHPDADSDDWVIVKIEDKKFLRGKTPRVINIPSGHTDKRMVEDEIVSYKNISDSSGKNSSACSKCDEESAGKGSNSDQDQESNGSETREDEDAQDDSVNGSDFSEETGKSTKSGNESDDDENGSDSDEDSDTVEYKDEDTAGQGDCLENDACEHEEENDKAQEEDESDGDVGTFYDQCPGSCSFHNGEKRKSERARLDLAPSCGSDGSDCEKDNKDDNHKSDSENEDDSHYLQMAILNSLAQTRNMPLQAQRFARLAKLKGEPSSDFKDASKICNKIKNDSQKCSTSTCAKTNNNTDTDRIVNISRQDKYGSRGTQNQSLISTQAPLADIHPTEHPHCSVDGDELDGDTLEIHCNKERSGRQEKSPSTSDSPSPVCSTRVEFTPAVTRTEFTPASIPVNGVPIRYSGGVSVESGRDNPQAKPDREVRQRDHRKEILRDEAEMQNGHDGRRSRSDGQVQTVRSRKTDVTSRILNNAASDGRALVLEKQTIRRIHPVLPLGSLNKGAGTQVRAYCREPDKKLIHNAGRESFQPKKQFSYSAKVSSLQKVRPTVPVHLRSTASYRDGQIDVSILGDQNIFGDVNPVNINVTFVHTQENKAETTLSFETQQTMDLSGPVFNKTMVIPPIKPSQNIASKTAIYGIVKSRDIKQLIKKTELAQRNKLSPIKTPKRADHPMKTKTTENHRIASHTGGKKTRRKLRVKYSPANFDVINYRSQWPPFNTSTNPETCRIYRNMVTGLSFIL